MKKILFVAAMFVCVLTAASQVSVEISYGLDNPTLRRKVEKQTELLLNAINNAAARNSDINFTGLNISDNASQALSSTWNQMHFRTEDDSYVENALTLKTKTGKKRGYQIRNLGVSLIPLTDEELPWERQELCVDFSLDGRIIDVNFTMNNVQYAKALLAARELDDAHERMQILSWCEKYAQYYIDKDIKSLEAIFAPDALIISGKVIVGRETSSVQLDVQTTQEYIRKMKRIFAQNAYIGVDFDEYEIQKHPVKKDIYFVTLRQRWTTKNYSDVGTLTLVWDFTDEDFPKIQVRAWQPLGMKPFTVSSIPFYD